VDDVNIWGCGGEGGVSFEFVEGLLSIVLRLVNDRDVEDGRRVLGIFTEGGGEQGDGFLRSAAVEGNVAETIEGLGIPRTMVQGSFVATLGLVEPASAGLGVAELDPAIGGLRLERGVAGKVFNGCAQIVLFEGERAKIVAGGGKVDVEPEGFPIIALSLFELPRAVVGEAQMVPRLRIARQVPGCLLKRFYRFLELAFLNQLFTVEEGGRPGRATAGEEKREANTSGKPGRAGYSPGVRRAGDGAPYPGYFLGPILDDQHLWSWYHWGLAVSRNAGLYTRVFGAHARATFLAAVGVIAAGAASWAHSADTPGPARVVVAYHPGATEAFKPRRAIISNMVAKGIVQLTGASNAVAAWRSLVSTQDTVGIKVYSSPGANSGTRPEVAAALVEGLLAAGVPARQIILWDKHRGDLRRAGYFEMVERYGIRVEGAAQVGYDDKTFYETAFLGQLVWGDLEFGKTGEGIGRRSYVSRLISKEITKIINVTPMLNHNAASVCGNLFSLAAGSVDNTFRFEHDARLLGEAVPEIYALETIGDRVVLNITDALICQYQGEQRTLLHYSTVLNELWFSRDPVALDVLSIRELVRQRSAAEMNPARVNSILYENAELLELGVAEVDRIRIERVKM